jgi:hypothetical protein
MPHRFVPGAIGLDFHGNTHGSFIDAVQRRLEQKLRVLAGGDMAKPIVATSFNVAHFDGYNLALRVRHAGYTNVYRYRGGREAWEVINLPETERPHRTGDADGQGKCLPGASPSDPTPLMIARPTCSGPGSARPPADSPGATASSAAPRWQRRGVRTY